MRPPGDVPEEMILAVDEITLNRSRPGADVKINTWAETLCGGILVSDLYHRTSTDASEYTQHPPELKGGTNASSLQHLDSPLVSREPPVFFLRQVVEAVEVGALLEAQTHAAR